MAVEIPGLSLSILRQETRVEAGQPLLVSGRLTAFGLGVPAYIRVTLEGPSYDPQTRTFDTFASPFSGDYSVNVIAEKGGSYEVYAQAMPPPLIPSTPLTPDAMLLLPAIAESTHPPIAVGDIVEGGVSYLDQYGGSQFLQTPVQTPIEINPYVAISPSVFVTAPGVPQSVYAGIAPTIPTEYPPYTPEDVEGELAETISANLEDITMSPAEINPGQEATGMLTWRNTSASAHSFDTAIYLVDQRGVRHGPLQLETDKIAAPGIPQVMNLRLSTTGLPSGYYSVDAETYNTVTGQLIDTIRVPYRLIIRSIEAAPEVPEVPEVPTPPEVPTAPTANIIGQPTLNLSRQIRQGDMWSGNVTLPTAGLAPYYIAGQLSLVSPTGQEVSAADYGRILQPGETLTIPVNLNTYNLTPGSYTVFLTVADQFGNTLIEFPMGFLTLLEAMAELPGVPEIPTLPTGDMIQTPFVNLPSQVTFGDMWSGNISIPTWWPITLPQDVSVPSYNYGALVQLESPSGQRFDVARVSSAFTPGRDISIPVNYDTGLLPGAADYNILLDITDIQGRDIFDNVIGMLDVLGAMYRMAEVSASPYAGGGIRFVQPPEYTSYLDEGDIVTYEAVPTEGYAFDHWEINGIPFSSDNPLSFTVGPSILSPGIFNTLKGVFSALPAGPEVPELSEFSSITVDPTPQVVKVGESITLPITIVHAGAAETVSLHAAIGDQRAAILGGFDEIWSSSKNITVSAHALPTVIRESLQIPITQVMGAPGVYSVYAKINTFIPKIESPHLLNIITVVEEEAAPPEEEVPPAVSEFISIRVQLGGTEVKTGDTLRVPVTYIHQGPPEDVIFYAAIGRQGYLAFNEILYGSIPISVPRHDNRGGRGEYIPIEITDRLPPGTYDVYAKITGRSPEVISPAVRGVVTCVTPVLGPSTFSNLRCVSMLTRYRRGSNATILMQYLHEGRAERVRFYAAIGQQNAHFDEEVAAQKTVEIEANLEPYDGVQSLDIETDRLEPGVYDIYFKIDGQISPIVIDALEIVE